MARDQERVGRIRQTVQEDIDSDRNRSLRPFSNNRSVERDGIVDGGCI